MKAERSILPDFVFSVETVISSIDNHYPVVMATTAIATPFQGNNLIFIAFYSLASYHLVPKSL